MIRYNFNNGNLIGGCPLDINIINEELTISMDVNNAVSDVIKVFENNDEPKNYIHKDDEVEVFMYTNGLEIEIFGCKCLFNVGVYDFFNDNLAKYLNKNAQIKMKREVINGNIHCRFLFVGNIIMKDGKVTEFSRSIIAHELRHAYEMISIYEGIPLWKTSDIDKISKKWQEIYVSALDYVHKYENGDTIKDTDFLAVMLSLYHSDKSEISAFTQQAYETCKDCKSREEVEEKMKTSCLYEMIETFRLTFKILNIWMGRYKYGLYSEMLGYNKLPSLPKLIRHLTKRYNKAYTNYCKVISLICGKFEENEGLDLVDVKY